MMNRAIHFSPAPGLVSLKEARFLVVVGLTGAGKSTFTRALGWPLLLGRRELVDRYVLPTFGADAAALDRAQRFELTSRWRRDHPGGVAEALAAGFVKPGWPLVFDGLRGEAEVSYAREVFAGASFVVLQAPFGVRLRRLLGRGDGFDRVALQGAEEKRLANLAAGLLSEPELRELLAGGHSVRELAGKLKILVEEQKNYHESGAQRALAGCARALLIDTSGTAPGEAAALVREWLGEK